MFASARSWSFAPRCQTTSNWSLSPEGKLPKDSSNHSPSPQYPRKGSKRLNLCTQSSRSAKPKSDSSPNLEGEGVKDPECKRLVIRCPRLSPFLLSPSYSRFSFVGIDSLIDSIIRRRIDTEKSRECTSSIIVRRFCFFVRSWNFSFTCGVYTLSKGFSRAIDCVSLSPTRTSASRQCTFQYYFSIGSSRRRKLEEGSASIYSMISGNILKILSNLQNALLRGLWSI